MAPYISSVRWSPCDIYPKRLILVPKATRASTFVANSVVEASIPTILLFCVIHKDVDYLYCINGRHFSPKAFRARFRMSLKWMRLERVSGEYSM